MAWERVVGTINTIISTIKGEWDVLPRPSGKTEQQKVMVMRVLGMWGGWRGGGGRGYWGEGARGEGEGRRRIILWCGLLAQTLTAKPRIKMSICGLIRALSLMSRVRAGPDRDTEVPGNPEVPRQRDSGSVTSRRWKCQRTPFGFLDNYLNLDLSALRRFVSGSSGERQVPKPSLSPPG